MSRDLADLVHDIRGWLDEARSRGAVDDLAAIAPSSLAPVAPGTLEGVRTELGDCTRCGLCAGRNNIVFGVGNPAARLLVVGEGPGEQEDKQGEPFVGPAGEMLDRMLQNVLGLGRGDVYICNVVKCRPPGNRAPAPGEVAACLPFLEAQIQAVAPDVLLVLGAVALKALFNDEGGIKRARGSWRTWRGIATMPTFHPAYLLRTPADKRLVFDDLKAVRDRLSGA